MQEDCGDVQNMDISDEENEEVEPELQQVTDLGDKIILKSTASGVEVTTHTHSIDLSEILTNQYLESRPNVPLESLSPEELVESSTLYVPAIPDVEPTYKVFELFARWMDYHRINQDEHFKYRKESCEKIGDWDQKFLEEIGVDHDTLFSLLLLSNFLGCKHLLQLCCKHIAKQIIELDVDEVKKHFGIKESSEQQQSQDNDNNA